ncbi:hypothetical protein EJ08DRAFT_615340 [Tothia fuscella]|uniref:Uncharacterized protein n=1 Tax=Tothia fuscella TaxID=1048955 RepID=A0A9P4TWG6_9PEZI|nr:hypothetical protein EJ08DRAFT_615340 [Tothia fuscella]
MARFNFLYVYRSDGKPEVILKAGRQKEKNEPTAAQLDSKPNSKGISDYYREISYDETKHTDWRRKLAGMLIRELKKSDFGDQQAYILNNFPENYRLFEHVKSKASDVGGTDAKSSKTHAGGGHDRQDAYLYGHPLGRKKRFRSPADFFPHLLWLCTDADGDPMNCACKICAPDELQPDIKAEKRETALVQKDNKLNVNSAAYRGPIVEIRVPAKLGPGPGSNIGIQRSNIPASGLAPLGSPATGSRPDPRQTSALPTKLTPDQQLDSTINQFSFRPGEMVWFDRGQAWGLGMIVRRWRTPQQTYLLQPITHPFDTQQQHVINKEGSLRPWLAWSPPSYMHSGLNGMTVAYESMNWQALMAGHYGESSKTSMEVDGSIIAAKMVDGTYTPLECIMKFLADPQKPDQRDELHYNAIFIGAEKLWLGDPARLRTHNEEEVLVISTIVEKPISKESWRGIPQSTPTSVTLIGDTYIIAKHTPQTLISPPSEQNIPTRMLEDIKARNRTSSRANLPPSYWHLTKTRASVPLSMIKGRWYEWSTMLPIIKSTELDQFEANLAKGKVESMHNYFNARNEFHGVGGGVRKERREEAFGKSIPGDVLIVDGVGVPEGVSGPGVQPRRATSGQGGGASQQQQSTFATSSTSTPVQQGQRYTSTPTSTQQQQQQHLQHPSYSPQQQSYTTVSHHYSPPPTTQQQQQQYHAPNQHVNYTIPTSMQDDAGELNVEDFMNLDGMDSDYPGGW